MAKIHKKGKAGQAKNFITRTQAVRKLQISLPDFRRLCIFKGIYPREPRNKRKVSKGATSSTTFYYTKDVQYLLHEPLLARFRDHKALSKKIARSLGKGEYGNAARLDKKDSARLSLDHIIKERYPTFVDALRDLDDALSLLFLFANLPSTSNVPPKTIRLCQRLCHEFQHFIILSNSLRKSFLSIKGIYYQATIQGQDIMWLVPYKFVQRVTSDVDFRIMGTFVEFYTTLLGFVNYRLYASLGLVYPPRFNAKSDERGAELGAFTVEGINLGADDEVEQNGDVEEAPKALMNGSSDVGAQKSEEALQQAISAQTEGEDEEERAITTTTGINDIDTFVTTGDGADELAQPQVSDFDAAKLFAGMHVFISRESPRQPLEFIIKAFGCKRVSWPEILGDGAFTHDEKDTSITHQIVDRPSVPTTNGTDDSEATQIRAGYVVPGRIYVQPQWVWDCMNANKLQQAHLYAPGTLLPPHLSPWVKAKPGAYDPLIPLAEQEAEGEAEDAENEAATLPPSATNDLAKEEIDVESADESDEVDENGMQIADDDDDDEEEEEDEDEDSQDEEDEEEDPEALLDFEEEVEGFGEEDEEDEEQDDDKLHEAELAAEAAGLDSNIHSEDPETRAKQLARKERQRKKQEAEEELQRQLGMMSKKKRKLYEKMRFSNQQKEDEAAKLRAKRRKIEKA